ncbi:MAG TPA: Hpt domain-containing protein [Burkholderiaceae bacterium]|nr:Hpt domain-containing protein [Burkholderiaceae bacterium]
MAERHDPNQLVGAAPDVAPLAWVIDEIRTSLTEAVNGLKAFLANKQDVDSLRNARNQIHQANGALQLLDLRGVALVTDAVEQLTRRFEAEPKECLPAGVRSVETALSAVVAYLEALLSGRPNQPIRLFPYYRDVLQLNRANRVHPADLIFPDLSRRPAFHQIESRQYSPEQLRERRSRFELGLLGFLRNADDPGARKRMLDALVDLEHLPQRGLARSFWWVVRGLLEGLDAAVIPVDVDLKRVLARLNLQLRRMIEGGGAVAERLMIDALYYVGRAQGGPSRLAEIRRLYGLDALIPADFERASLTAVDADALRSLKEALAQAKLLWGQTVAGGGEPPKFAQEIKLARDSAARLSARALGATFEAIGRVTLDFAKLPTEMRERLGLEVASALLFADLGVDDLPQTDVEYEGRAQQVIDRLLKARKGEPLPEAGPWMSELARRAQDRLTMGTVVAETQSTLREIEQRLDRFFRNPAEREDLPATTAMFDQVCGVLSLLGYEDPVAALRNVQESIGRFADAAIAPEPEEFSRIAQNLGAVGFFVESLGQDTERPRGMFHYDPATGVFTAELGQLPADEAVFAPADEEYHAAPRTIDMRVAEPRRTDNVETATRKTLEAAHHQAERLTRVAGDARAIGELDRLLPMLSNEADLLDNEQLKSMAARALQLLAQLKDAPTPEDAVELELLLAPPKAPEAPPPTAPLPSSQAAADDELREIFVEEAREVLDSIVTHLDELRARRDDKATLTTVRRAFHTLKGSSRMVGFKHLGEGAWGVEQCFNLWLAQERPATDDLIDLADGAQRVIRAWVETIARDSQANIDPTPLVLAAQRVREGGMFEYAALPPGAAPPKPDGSAPELHDVALPAPASQDLSRPAAAPVDFDLGAMPGAAATAEPRPELRLVRAEGHEESGPATESLPLEILPAGEHAAPAQGTAAGDADAADEEVRRIGPLEISHGLYSVFLNEADECVRVLAQDINEWRYEPARMVSAQVVRRAHSLSGISKTVGLAPVIDIADPLDDLMHTLSMLAGAHHYELTAAQYDTLERVIERMRGMLHQFAAGVYPDEAPFDAGALHDIVAIVRAHGALHEELAAQALPSSTEPVESSWVESPADAGPAVETLNPEVPEFVAPDEATAEAPADEAHDAIQEATAFAVAVEAEAPSVADDVTAEPDIVTRAADIPAATADAEAEAETEVVSRVRDEIDADLLQVFLAEAADLLPAIGTALRGLESDPNDREVARDLMRRLHTVKGSARMAGAMRLGELVHDMETRMEAAMQLSDVPGILVEDLQGQYDKAIALYDELQNPEAAVAAPVEAPAPVTPPTTEPVAAPLAPVIDLAAARGESKPELRVEKPAMPLPSTVEATMAATAPAQQTAPFIRVRADVLDKLVDQAGEVSIARSKLENEVSTIKGSLTDLTENIQRLRAQLREVEIQAEAQLQARGASLSRESADFDPLEFDRYTRLQELTRMLAESVEDVAMVQSNMVKGLQAADTDLTSQSRLTRDLQQQLMRVRLVPFSNVSERLYRVARQTAKELGKRVNVDLRGGATEIDRGVLEKMVGPFEHLIRNAIVHGLERPEVRRAAGKAEVGELVLDVRQEANEIVVVLSDDGAGLPLERIRERAIERELIGPDQALGDREAMDLIFLPGFSTATEVTELAGRGVGMDVVRAELASFGGRIAVSSETGRGTRFTLYLPMTLAVAQVVLARIGSRRYALPAGMVEQVRRYRPAALLPSLAEGMIDIPPIGTVVLRPLSQLVGEETSGHLSKQTPVVLLKSGDDRMAIAVDDVSSNQEVVVKNVGAQVARLAGILGATILGNGEIVLIINPVQLITRAPEPPAIFEKELRAEAKAAPLRTEPVTEIGIATQPTVMVVDDSLTVRRVTQRLLERNNFTVLLAKDGVDALRQLQDTKPDVMLVDIEMPRMDGYDLTRNIRSSPATSGIPIIMITSRTAEKHRSMAFELGVNEYLGKPYQEDELMKLVRQYLGERVTA